MTNANKSVECSYTTFVSGNSSFYDAVGIPLAAAFESDLPSHGICHHDGNLDECFAVNSQSQNAHWIIEGAVGVILLSAVSIGTHLAGKIVDDVYTIKIQPLVKKNPGASRPEINENKGTQKENVSNGRMVLPRTCIDPRCHCRRVFR